MEHYDPDFLTRLYATMLRIRSVEESFVQPILDGTIRCPVHLYTGEEAVAAGVCAALTERDYVFGTHRSHGHYLAMGGDLVEMVAEVFCREDGCCKGRGGSMHLVAPEKGMIGAAPIVAGTISLALGAALAARTRDEQSVAVAFFGDGATGEGVLHECLNLASLMDLPMLFVCENNLYSTHMCIDECRPNRDIHRLAEPFGIRNAQVDGNDVIAVFEEASGMVEHCRAGRGPAFLECRTYRMRGHVGPDDNIQGSHTDIRPKEEVEQWRKRDPIKSFARRMVEAKKAREDELEAIRNMVEKQVQQAHEVCTHSPWPKPEELTRYVFDQ